MRNWITIGLIVLLGIHILPLNIAVSQEETPELPESVNGLYAGFLDHDLFGAMAVHENGEMLVTMVEDDRITGGMWFSPEGDSITVFFDEEGLPERLFVDEYIFIFSDYTDETVTITVVDPDNAATTLEDVAIDAELLSELKAETASETSLNETHEGIQLASYNRRYRAFSLSSMLRTTATAIKVGVCSVGVAGLAMGTFGTGGAGAPVLVAVGGACAAVGLDAVRALLPEHDENLTKGSLALGAATCTLGFITAVHANAFDCLAFAMEIVESRIEENHDRNEAYLASTDEGSATTGEDEAPAAGDTDALYPGLLVPDFYAYYECVEFEWVNESGEGSHECTDYYNYSLSLTNDSEGEVLVLDNEAAGYSYSVNISNPLQWNYYLIPPDDRVYSMPEWTSSATVETPATGDKCTYPYMGSAHEIIPLGIQTISIAGEAVEARVYVQEYEKNYSDDCVDYYDGFHQNQQTQVKYTYYFDSVSGLLVRSEQSEHSTYYGSDGTTTIFIATELVETNQPLTHPSE